ncbi:Hsp20/alpha crystallin family protein [Wenzhouxiangella sp. AB-CW3]|uniref:Hsp20/alpha crystallin family protein n=1 Tax=Wenzhouxiangella sp. AB-CW3 TaxID=2771012 RepID=UPI00168B186F|nr:Hsp20/alpha crystallin family protein [Wenzhouxiangella sp. AB-CW3]QOC22109.1 Hsp20/alpha crystallin family protein [Wenzhouxiangella sp. AB-CW3]
MNLQKLSPWNWFKREEQGGSGDLLPARGSDDPLTRMHREIDRLFEGFFGAIDRPSDLQHGLVLRPSIDIAESKKSYRISVEVPGVDEEDIDLTLDGDALIISGEKRQESEEDEDGYHRIERSYGSFRRVLTLPSDADPDGITANFRKGVLKIVIPRSKEGNGSRKRIEIG